MSGYLRELGNGKYQAVISNGTDENGKRIFKTKTFEAKSRREAERIKDEFFVEVKRKPPTTASKITFAMFCKVYEQRHLARLKESTKAVTVYDIDLKLKPYFGRKKLQKITVDDVENFLLELGSETIQSGENAGKPLSKGSIFKYYRILRAVFNKAVEWKYLDRSPLDDLPKSSRPKEVHKKRVIYEEDELAKFLAALFALPDKFKDLKYKLMLYLSLICGLRRGEVLGLTYDDVNLEKKTVTVRRAEFQVTGKKGEADPKTESSKRTVYIDDRVVELVKKYKAEQDAWILRRNLKNPRKLLFTEIRGVKEGSELKNAAMICSNKWLTDFAERNGLKHISSHALRHMACTYALAHGADLPAVQALMGHDKVTTTALYTHTLEAKKKDTAATLSNAFGDLLDSGNKDEKPKET